jgi:5'-deoxynucleotidase YfbR-like HD superfamily hydrolase
MLCWRVFTEIQPNLSLERIFKYALAHDFLERGLRNDVNTYASPAERNDKESYERAILKQLSVEFSDFDDMILVIQDYENQIDEESRFVKTIDKMQAIILGELDEWRPYAKINVSHQEFTEKGESFLDGCPDCLKETLSELNKHTRTTFYDQPVS